MRRPAGRLLPLLVTFLLACHTPAQRATSKASGSVAGDRPTVLRGVSLDPRYSEWKGGAAPELRVELEYDSPLRGDPGSPVFLHWGRLVGRTWNEITYTPMKLLSVNANRATYQVRLEGLPPSTYEFCVRVTGVPEIWVNGPNGSNGRFEIHGDPPDPRTEVPGGGSARELEPGQGGLR